MLCELASRLRGDAEAAGASELRAKVAELLWLLNELKEAVARHDQLADATHWGARRG